MLKLCDVKDASQSVWLVAPKVTIGRSSQCDLTLADGSIAKLHAEIRVNGEDLELCNLAGNGQVAVNGALVKDSRKLKRNDRVQLGDRNLVVVDPKVTRVKAVGAGANISWALRANHPAIVGRVFPVRETSVVGRSDECDLAFAMSHLSRRHARLEIREGLLFVVDLGSANGTYLNNQQVTESRVRRGDELRFDSLSFSVVGPADDLDKTTVRQAVSMPEPARQGAAQGAILGQELQRSGAASKTAPAGAAYQNYSGNSATASGWVWVCALLAGVAVAGYFWASAQGLV